MRFSISSRCRTTVPERPSRATAAIAGLACALLTAPAFASKEGAGVAEAVALIVYVALAALVVCVIGGVVVGIVRAQRAGDPVLKGFGTGVLKGLGAFVILCAVSLAALTGLGFLWMALVFIAEWSF
jgi:hypothetical protein